MIAGRRPTVRSLMVAPAVLAATMAGMSSGHPALMIASLLVVILGFPIAIPLGLIGFLHPRELSPRFLIGRAILAAVATFAACSIALMKIWAPARI